MIYLALNFSFPTCRIEACFIPVFRAQQVSTHPEFVEAEDIENKNARSYVFFSNSTLEQILFQL